MAAGLMEKLASSSSSSKADKEIYPTEEKRLGTCTGQGPGAVERAEDTEEKKEERRKEDPPPLGWKISEEKNLGPGCEQIQRAEK